MDFELNDEQRLLKDSVDRLMADRYAFENRKGFAKEASGWSTDLWGRYAELGLLGLPFSEEHGGAGGVCVRVGMITRCPRGGACARYATVWPVPAPASAIRMPRSAIASATASAMT